jgi:lipopolysaccharide biosynthesis regulator YciM
MINTQVDTLLLFAIGLLAGIVIGRVLPRKDRSPKNLFQGRTGFYKSLNYILSNEHDKAIEEFTRMVEVDSETVEVYLGLGSLFRSKGEVGRAIRIHQSIIVRPSLDKKIKIQAYFDLALDYQKAGLFDSAIETLKTVIQLDPHHLKAYKHLEKIYEDEKSWGKAFETEKQIQKLTKTKNPLILAHLQTEMAKSLQEQNQIEEAIRGFKKAIQIDQRCVDAYLHLGDLYHGQGKFQKAIELWEGVAGRTPEYAFLTYKRFESSFYELGKYGEMEEIYKQNVMRNSKDIQTRLVLGDHYFRKGDLNAALQEFQEVIKISPNCIDAHQKLGEILLAEGKNDEAREEYRILVEIFSRKYLFYHCSECGFESKNILWRCPQCKTWDAFVH